VSPEPELTIARDRPAREVSEAGRARVRSELLAETNGPYTTSELSYFLVPSPELRVPSPHHIDRFANLISQSQHVNMTACQQRSFVIPRKARNLLFCRHYLGRLLEQIASPF
jgi:hypothetical protein